MAFDLSRPIVMCAQASNRLRPGYKLGYNCVECGKALQVSPSGVPMIKSGGQPLCNPCGDKVIEALNFSESPATLVFGPDAVDEIKRATGEPIEKTFPNAQKIYVKP